jgi:hypothetical protein
MFARFVKPAAIKPAGSIHARIAQQTRFLATVEGSIGRKMPVTRPKATPISHDRATFTIRVCYTSAGYEEFWLTLYSAGWSRFPWQVFRSKVQYLW